ncbi:MAG: thioredoxin family protein [Bacteroidetes bacterium]|nr:MAG: thioredoxin family protein [Bacteroidota bacterium]
MEIKVLGTGCPNCITLEKRVQRAVKESGVIANINKVEDIEKIMEYDVMSTPALVINEKVLVKGRVPSVDEIKELLSNKIISFNRRV